MNPGDVQCPECSIAIGLACSVVMDKWPSYHDRRYWAVGIPTGLGTPSPGAVREA